jgi:hypothetical protein
MVGFSHFKRTFRCVTEMLLGSRGRVHYNAVVREVRRRKVEFTHRRTERWAQRGRVTAAGSAATERIVVDTRRFVEAQRTV